jgi:hypothetical protein
MVERFKKVAGVNLVSHSKELADCKVERYKLFIARLWWISHKNIINFIQFINKPVPIGYASCVTNLQVCLFVDSVVIVMTQ